MGDTSKVKIGKSKLEIDLSTTSRSRAQLYSAHCWIDQLHPLIPEWVPCVRLVGFHATRSVGEKTEMPVTVSNCLSFVAIREIPYSLIAATMIESFVSKPPFARSVCASTTMSCSIGKKTMLRAKSLCVLAQ